MKTTHILSAVVFSAVISVSSFVSAGTLENLERERALTINTMLDPEVAIKIRQSWNDRSI